MSRIFGNKYVLIAFNSAVLFGIIAGGIALRLPPIENAPPTLSENYLAAYYFDKFQRLVSSGIFPKEDVWQWAPAVHPENAPPGLAYISAALFKLALIPSTLGFADLFPVIAFALWCAGTLTLFARKRMGFEKSALFLAVLAFTPAAISLTRYANYTQETLGVMLLFFAAYALMRFERTRENAVIAGFLVFFLVLTWQQFPVFYIGAAAIILASVLQKKRCETRWLLATAFIPLVSAELVMWLIVRSGYSPLRMIWEFALGAWMQLTKDPDFLTAMVRNNWRSIGVGEFWQSFGPLTIGLAAIGFLSAFRNLADQKRFATLIFGAAGIAAAFRFQKEVNLAFGLVLLPIMLALEDLVELAERGITVENVAHAADRLTASLRRRRFVVAVNAFAISGIAGWIFLTSTPQGIALVTKENPPEPKITASSQKNDDGTVDITLRMANRGGTTFFSDKIWFGMSSGMHIAIGNAEIVKFSATSESSPPGWRHYSVYPYARWGDFYFVETRYKRLRNGQAGEVRLKLRPFAEDKNPVIYYRGWMPETSCILRYKNIVGATPEELWMLETEGEPCIIRTPDHFDADASLCPNTVMAARLNLQYFKCNKILLER